MKTLRAIQVVGLIVVFGVLGIGYLYFQEQSELQAGRARAQAVIEDITQSNGTDVKQQLYNINGTNQEQANELTGLRRAIHNIDYVHQVDPNGQHISFVDHFIEDSPTGQLYRAIYSIPDSVGGEDYVGIVFIRTTDQWRLSDVVLTAVNPVL